MKGINSASISEKIILRGEFYINSPLRIGDGGSGSQETDIYVLKNRLQQPLIPGSSLAGVLRSVCKSFKGISKEIIEAVFGSESDDLRVNSTTSRQSAIDINDVLLNDFRIVVRDGVAIDSRTGTSMQGAKYNYETVEKGAHGKLELVVTLRKDQDVIRKQIEDTVREIAKVLVNGIRVGSLTSKGFGLGKCRLVTADFFDFSQPRAVKAYFLDEEYNHEIIKADENKFYAEEDFVVDVDLTIDTSLLIRQETGEKIGDLPIKAEQMQHRNEDGKTDYYIIPGTSIKGVLRHQASRILEKVGQNSDLLNDLMGDVGQSGKSRLIVDETYIKANDDLLQYTQARNSIDRFTGGTITGRLFGEKVISRSNFKIHFEVKPCRKSSIDCRGQRKWDLGLVMFLLKDLCTGKITLGSEKAIGRGILKGNRVIIHYMGKVYELNDKGQVIGNDVQNMVKVMEDWGESFLIGEVGV